MLTAINDAGKSSVQSPVNDQRCFIAPSPPSSPASSEGLNLFRLFLLIEAAQVAAALRGFVASEWIVVRWAGFCLNPLPSWERGVFVHELVVVMQWIDESRQRS